MSRPIPASYRGAIDSPCPTCGAEPGDFCVIDDDRRPPRIRRVPCVRRCPRGPPDVDEPPRRSTRSFSEPLHNPTEPKE